MGRNSLPHSQQQILEHIHLAVRTALYLAGVQYLFQGLQVT